MKKSLFPIFVAVIALLVSAPALVGGGKKKATPPPMHQRPVIAAVTGNSITVTEENATRTFAITQFTEINVNGRRATAADLKPGMTVSVRMGTDPSIANGINATGAGQDRKK